MINQFDCKYCKESFSPQDNLNKETLCNQLKQQQNEIERSCEFIEELREKISWLEKCFNYLSSEKKSIEIETNKKISHLTNKVMKLQSEKEQIRMKYNSTKQKVKSMHAANRSEIEIYKTENIKLQKEKEELGRDIKELIIENDRLIAQVNYYYSHGTLNQCNTNRIDSGIEESSSPSSLMPSYRQPMHHNDHDNDNGDSIESIAKLKSYIKNLEHRNEALTKELDTHIQLSRDNSSHDIIIGLKRVISEKERTINSLYNKYDKLNIKLEDEVSKNDKLVLQIEASKSQLTNKSFKDNHNCNNPFIKQY